MATAKTKQQIEALKSAIAAHPKGASLDQILSDASPLGISRNTLIRRLNDMVSAGQLTKAGLSRAARYSLPQPSTPPAAVVVDDVVPLSEIAQELQVSIRRPQEARTPVGYQFAFLNNYRPNETYYLTDDQRRRLAELGKTNEPAQPAGTHAQHILKRLLIDLSFNSSRLEGNTYSLLDTQRLIEYGEEAEGKNASDAQMIVNHKEAIEFLVDAAADIDFDRPTILNLHAKLSDNLLEDPDAVGRLRRIGVGITGTVFHPLGVPQQIEENFDQILATARAIQDPFEQSFFAMVQLPYLQPFDDVNKRVSRLAANIPMIKRNLSPISFTGVPPKLYLEAMLAVYEQNRVELLRDVFLWAYERSAQRYAAIRQSVGEPDPFRLRHRQNLRLVVADVIKGKLDKKAAARFVANWATKEIAEQERARLTEMIETELLSLHEGNFARYAVRPYEFREWQEVWNAKPEPRSSSKSGRRNKAGD
jgi:hypothetical protein